jgi:hypothetical protein
LPSSSPLFGRSTPNQFVFFYTRQINRNTTKNQ